ncbi:hypothetical protein [Solitalea koreensis]|uniref:Uncharacterized protein n=1 Tax=Solitalea koreensis TaxID=543615 RepID=A0A521C8X1_9SPHI|nr:hypothetical protein [Solitalea koreensis]SMO55942.1 hypothetical protein SAMN06265350_103303 [Solitalea koreensis]
MKEELEINADDLAMIMGKKYDQINEIIDSCFCAHCTDRRTSIVNYKLYLNRLDDVILKGRCAKCNTPVNRYIETGENNEMACVAQHIRMIIKKYRKIKA